LAERAFFFIGCDENCSNLDCHWQSSSTIFNFLSSYFWDQDNVIGQIVGRMFKTFKPYASFFCNMHQSQSECFNQILIVEKDLYESKSYVSVKYRCEKCGNQFEGIIKKGAGSIRLTCSFCGSSIVVFI
jgi:DNA-directed RNA polymerase subunit RPC12/RpoP